MRASREAYLVKFTDGRSPSEQIVPLEHIHPSIDHSEECHRRQLIWSVSHGTWQDRKSCCAGWLSYDDMDEARYDCPEVFRRC